MRDAQKEVNLSMNFWFCLMACLWLATDSVIAQSNLISTTVYYEGKPTLRTTYQYDAQRREVARKEYVQDQYKDWVILFATEKDFDQSGRQILYRWLQFNYSEDSLTVELKVETSYNDAGMILKEVSVQTNYVTYLNSILTVYTSEVINEYNQQGCNTSTTKRTHFIGSEESETIQFDYHEFDISCRKLKTTSGDHVSLWKYDENNLLLYRQYQISIDSTLIEERQYVDGRLMEEYIPEQKKETYEYDIQGNKQVVKSYRWSGGVFSLVNIYYFTYNSSNQLIREQEIFGFDLPTQPPRGQNDKTYLYNELGKISSIESNIIYYEGGEYNIKTSFSYRCDGLVSELVKSEFGNPTYMRVVSHYSSPAPCEGPITQTYQIYPNPTTNVVFINSYEHLENTIIKILSTSGQVIKVLPDTKKLAPLEVDLNDLIPGIYIIRIESEGAVYHERIVKK